MRARRAREETRIIEGDRKEIEMVCLFLGVFGLTACTFQVTLANLPASAPGCTLAKMTYCISRYIQPYTLMQTLCKTEEEHSSCHITYCF